ncbi:MAG: hypothetical protein V4605_08855 [Pseudomonadota bacterium]
MGGGINNIADFAGGTSLGGGGSLGGLGAVAVANPWLAAGMAVIGALKGSTKISAAKGEAFSGVGGFAPKNRIKTNAPMVDFSQPMQVATLAVVVVIGIYIFKKVK